MISIEYWAVRIFDRWHKIYTHDTRCEQTTKFRIDLIFFFLVQNKTKQTDKQTVLKWNQIDWSCFVTIIFLNLYKFSWLFRCLVFFFAKQKTEMNRYVHERKNYHHHPFIHSTKMINGGCLFWWRQWWKKKGERERNWQQNFEKMKEKFIVFDKQTLTTRTNR